jgi:hypothetical protein
MLRYQIFKEILIDIQTKRTKKIKLEDSEMRQVQ